MAVLSGTSGDDVITASLGVTPGVTGGTPTNLSDTLNGLGGDDILEGGTGLDSLDGGSGFDVLLSTDGGDTLRGGAGSDLFIVALTYTLLSGLGGVLSSPASMTIGIDFSPSEGDQFSFGGEGVAAGRYLINAGTLAARGTLATGFALPDFRAGRDVSQFFWIPETGGAAGWGIVDLDGDLVLEDTDLAFRLVFADGTDASVFDPSWAEPVTFAIVGTAAADNLSAGAEGYLLAGGGANDTLNGSAEYDQFFGEAGNDRIFGFDGDDFAIGGIGDDLVEGGVGIDEIWGDLGDNAPSSIGGADTLRGNADDDVLYGEQGNDRLEGGAGDDSLDGGLGNDEAVFTGNRNQYAATWLAAPLGPVTLRDMRAGSPDGFDTVAATEFFRFADGVLSLATLMNLGSTLIGTDSLGDTLNGTTGPDRLDGLALNDNLSGFGNADTLIGGDGDDTLSGGDGNDSLEGAGGIGDIADYAGAPGVVAVVSAGAGTVTGFGTDTLGGIESLFGGGGNDSLVGLSASSSGIMIFRGQAGADTIAGPDTPDRNILADYFNSPTGIIAQLGPVGSVVDGFGSTDVLRNIYFIRGSNSGGDTITGSDLDDRFRTRGGNDSVDGGAGLDIFDTTQSTLTGANIDLAAGRVFADGDGGADTIANIEQVWAGILADTIRGSDGDDVVSGGAGADSLDGRGGIDRLVYDVVAGVTPAQTRGIVLDLAAGRVDDPWGVVDSIAGFERFTGSALADRFIGDAFGSRFNGRGGNDTLIGGGGSDWAEYFSAGAGVSVNLALGTASDGENGADSLVGISNAIGSGFADVLTGVSSPTAFGQLRGGRGDDRLVAAPGAFVAASYGDQSAGVLVNLATGRVTDATLGADTLEGIRGVVMFGDFADTLVGSAADEFFAPDRGGDSVDGGGGIDILAYWDATGGVLVNLATGRATDHAGGIDSIAGIEWAVGRFGADTFIGTAGAETFTPGVGADTITGGGGGDALDYGFNAGPTYTPDAASSPLPVQGLDLDLVAGFGTDNGGATDSFTGIQHLRGGFGNDRLRGDGQANRLDGNVGADTLEGREGADLLTGAAGNDSLDGGIGTDEAAFSGSRASYGITTLAGGLFAVADLRADSPDGADTLGGIEWLRFADLTLALGAGPTESADTIDGSAGADSIDGLGGSDRLSGQDGGDTLLGGSGNDSLFGGDGDDSLDGGSGRDSLLGGAGADTLVIGTGTETNEYLAGEAGTDDLGGRTTFGVAGIYLTLDGGEGNDTIRGFGIFDNVADYATRSGPMTALLGLNGSASLPGGEIDTLLNVRNIRATAGADSILGSGASERFGLDRGGNDTVDAAEGTDRVDYVNYVMPGTTTGSGVRVDLSAERATIGGSVQVLWGFEAVGGSDYDDTIIGNALNNDIRPVGGADSIDGGEGDDTIRYTTGGSVFGFPSGGVVIDLDAGTALDPWGFLDSFVSIESATGTSSADDLTGRIIPGGSFSLLRGLAGADTLRGLAAEGDVSIFGDYREDPAAIRVNLSAGSLVVSGSLIAANTGLDGFGTTDRFVGLRGILGGASGDTIIGGAAEERLHGWTGNDLLRGGDGDDTLGGGQGADTYDGGAGFDLISFSPVSNIDAGVTTGVVASLLTGVIANDGYGNAEVIVGGAANSIEMLIGTSFGDDLTGRANAAAGAFGTTGPGYLRGGQGADTLRAAAEDSRNVATDHSRDSDLNDDGVGVVVNLVAQTATDGWGNTDTLVDIGAARGSAFADSLLGNDADNWFRGEASSDTIQGGGGTDFASYTSSPNGVVLDLEAGIAQDGHGSTDSLSGIEQASGSEVAGDTLRGDAQANLFQGYGGDDSQAGRGGDDRLFGHTGGDTLDGGEGADTLAGGAGNDSLAGGGAEDEAVFAGNRADFGITTLPGGLLLVTDLRPGAPEGADTLSDVERLRFADTVISTAPGGTEGPDTLTGGVGADSLDGLGGADSLVGLGAGDTLAGSAGADSLAGGAGGDRLDGGTERDLVDYAAAAGGIDLDLASGSAQDGEGGADTLLGIEDAAGSATGGDTLRGDTGANRLLGLGGSDQLAGRLGDDTLLGGTGIDSLAGSDGLDSLAGEGDADTLVGGNDADTLAGGGGNDSLDGGAGDDVAVFAGNRADFALTLLAGGAIAVADLRLGGAEGADTLRGLDRLRFDDTVVAALAPATEAADTILGTLGGDSIAALGGNDSVLGDAGADSILGGLGADTLAGGDGADTLDGQGGADSMQGGLGDDLFYVDLATDRAIESLDQGADTVIAAANYVLANNVEALLLTGAARSGTGNNQANLLVGTEFADTLYGLAGADTLDGGLGDDTYRADSTDLILDTGGIDRVLAQNSFSLVALPFLENLTFIGTNAANGTGNALGNLIIGNAAANRLDGNEGNDTLSGGDGNDLLRGGAGADSLVGGTGADSLQGGADNDTYLVTDALAVVTEGLNAGIDLVNATVSVVLGLNVENLVLLGAGTIDGMGNGLANVITGNGQANRLDGAGGADSLSGGSGNDVLLGGEGNDTLVGGAGADTLTGGNGSDLFRYDLVTQGPDRIEDYSVVADTIGISASGFGLSLANPINFVANATGLASTPGGTAQFIYRTDTLTLLFDADGQGGLAPRALLTFATAPAGFGASEIVLI